MCYGGGGLGIWRDIRRPEVFEIAMVLSWRRGVRSSLAESSIDICCSVGKSRPSASYVTFLPNSPFFFILDAIHDTFHEAT